MIPETAIHVKHKKTNWMTTLIVVGLHLGAVAALFTFSWPALIATAVLWWISLSWGIGMGYHRLLTHRSYHCPKFLEYFLTICATLALEGGPIFWVGTHRLHHQRSDQEGDPHSPRDGGWWAHVGWILCGQTSHNQTELLARYAPDLARDNFHRRLNAYHFVPIFVLGAILFAIGGWSMFLWGTFLRITVGLHCTWLVNSATHMWGGRRFGTRDNSRNNWWVALVTFGEGWHNNHHAHPTSARHGLAWYEVDLTWMQIRLLQLVGLIKRVKIAKITTRIADREAA